MRFFTALLALFFLPAAGFAEITPANTIVVANDNNDDSLAVAEYYMKARGIPKENLVLITFSNDEEIGWHYFAGSLWNPLIEQLKNKNFLTGEFLPELDSAGRKRMKVSENKIGAIVLCRGLPLRIRHDAGIGETENAENVKREFAGNGASTDSELALLALPESRATAFVPNPLFNKPTPPAGAAGKIICVARLDAPTKQDCFRLVDDALFAERNGLAGRAYIDLGGPHQQGNVWLRQTGELLKKAGFDTTTETTPALLCDTTRFDAPAFYFGWYAADIAGRLADPKTRFVPGAIALHIHSFSARTLRSPAAGWCGPLVAHGAAATLGNVAEPYLQLTSVPPVFMSALLENKTLGEAYLAATPAWSWQTILVGDPLYRPFTVSPEAQTEAAFRAKPARGFYAILRSAVLLKNAGNAGEAVKLLTRAFMRYPALPAIVALNAFEADAGKPVFLPASVQKLSEQEDSGTVLEFARFLAGKDKAPEALALYDIVLARENLSLVFLKTVPEEAAGLAEKAGDEVRAKKWRALIPPPPGPESRPVS